MGMNIVLLGPPYSGKGTQGPRIAERLGLMYFSTGNEFRDPKSPFHKAAKAATDSGRYVDDLTVTNLVREKLSTSEYLREGWVLDGYPRTLPQSTSLDKIVRKLNTQVDAVVTINCPESAIRDRALGRLLCSNPDCQKPHHISTSPNGKCGKCGSKLYQREDDKDKLATRLKEYEKTMPVIQQYLKLSETVPLPVDAKYSLRIRRGLGKPLQIIEIDGTMPKDEITEAILDGLLNPLPR